MTEAGADASTGAASSATDAGTSTTGAGTSTTGAGTFIAAVSAATAAAAFAAAASTAAFAATSACAARISPVRLAPISVGATSATSPFTTISTTRQRLSRESGRVSEIFTMSPRRHSLFSSCAL